MATLPALLVEMKTDGNSRKIPQLFSTSTIKYKNKSKSGKARYENEYELTEY